MTLRYNANLVADGAKKDGDGNTISTTYAKSASLSTVATSGDYTDLSNTPTIPAAQVQADWNETNTSSMAYIQNKPTIPSGVVVDQTYDGTSTNAQSGVAIAGELTNYALSSSVPTDTSDLTNGAGFITGISSTDVTNALGYTPYDSSNPSGYTTNTGTVTSVNNISPVNGNVTISIPSISGLEETSNKVTSLSSSSTDTQYPSAKSVFDLLKTIYPVGSVYLSTNATCPLASLFGTWTLVSSGRALWTGDGTNGDTTIAAGLPNIKGTMPNIQTDYASQTSYSDGCVSMTSNTSGSQHGTNRKTFNVTIDASTMTSSVYSDNVTTVQPPAYVVNVWKRTA